MATEHNRPSTTPLLQRPRLLMLSHCMPCATSHADRARAWQLLTTASASHDIDLLVVIDGAIRLEQWRSSYHRAKRITIVNPPAGQGLIARCLVNGDASATLLPATRGRIRTALAPWIADQAYDAVLCTHPLLCEHVEGDRAPLRVCDIHLPVTVSASRSAQSAGVRPSWIERRSRRKMRAVESRIASEWDIIATGDPQSIPLFAHYAAHSILLPEAVDITAIEPTQASAVVAGRVAFHADWRGYHSRGALRTFMQHTWREIAAAESYASMVDTHAETQRGSTPMLKTAQVVVTSADGPTLPRWTYLQPLAMGLPVVTSPAVADDLGARDGEQVRVVTGDSELRRACVELLNDHDLRQHLSTQARSFVESMHALAPTTNTLARLLTPTPATHRITPPTEGLALAA